MRAAGARSFAVGRSAETERPPTFSLKAKVVATAQPKPLVARPAAATFKRGEEIWVRVERFGVLGATVSVAPSDAAQSAADPALAAALAAHRQSGLVSQKEIAACRARRGGGDIAVGDVLRGYVSRVYAAEAADGDAAVSAADDALVARRMDVALQPLGKERIEENADLVLAALQRAFDGRIAVGDRSPPADVSRFFSYALGKVDFKNAVGALYRRGLVQPLPFEVRLLSDDERRAREASPRRRIDEKFLAARAQATLAPQRPDASPRERPARFFVGNVPRFATARQLFLFLAAHLPPPSDADADTNADADAATASDADADDPRRRIVSVRTRAASYRPHATDEHRGDPATRCAEGFAFVDVADHATREALVLRLQSAVWHGKRLRVDLEERSKEQRLAEKRQRLRGDAAPPAAAAATDGGDAAPIAAPPAAVSPPPTAAAAAATATAAVEDDDVDCIDRFIAAAAATRPADDRAAPSTPPPAASPVDDRGARFATAAPPAAAAASSDAAVATLFVGNVAYTTTTTALARFVARQLAAAPETRGVALADVRLIAEKFSGRPRGFAYVDLRLGAASDADAERLRRAACAALGGRTLDGRALRVDVTAPPEADAADA